MRMEWKDIKDAPKDGTTVWLCWFDGGVPMDKCKMHWDKNATNGLFHNKVGMWSSEFGTWNDDNDGGPTHFAWCN